MLNIDKLLTCLPQAHVNQMKILLSTLVQNDESEAFIIKSIEVVSILKTLNVDAEALTAAVLSLPTNPWNEQSLELDTWFGSAVASLVNDVKSLNQLQIYSTDMAQQPQQAEILRHMLLSIIQDVRAVLIKISFRVYKLRHLANEPPEIIRFIAQETLDIYSPIANRLGVNQLKWELEDLAFRYLQPENYEKLAHSLAATRNQRESIINAFITTLAQTLAEHHITAEIAGRPKHIYSIWNKMQRKGKNVDELYDLLAVRVIVSELTACYAVLGIVHGLWQYIPNEFDDYIANPKANGYQSLHTVIINPDGHRMEIQIRTQAMHEFAELGVAAHWRYKEGSKQSKASEKNISSLRQILQEKQNDEELVENFKSELIYHRIYVLTPAGKLIDLIKGATPLDFAYAIHTEVGHRCRGAKVDGRIVPLTYQLKSGEQVEILTAKGSEPNYHWIDSNLGYLVTPRAINKVKTWFRDQQVETNIALGKSILEKEVQQQTDVKLNLTSVCKHFKKRTTEQLYLAIGRGEITINQLTGFLIKPKVKKPKVKKAKPSHNKTSVLVQGMNNVSCSVAHCCWPKPGDAIVGYISHYKGITIHRSDCDNIARLSRKQQTQLIPVSWSEEQESQATDF